MRIFKNSILICLVLFLIIHTAFTLLYVFPENLSSSYLKEKSKNYVAPLFDQSWSLFAPIPEVNKKVYVSYQTKNKKWSCWEDPFANYLYAHQSSRVSAHAKIVFSLSNTLHYLYNENVTALSEHIHIIGNNSSGYFKVLANAVKNKLRHENKEAQNLKILVVFTKANCSAKKMYAVYYPEFETVK